MNEKILIFIITYKASFRLINVFRKIPINFFGNKNLKILISDDDSEDDTLEYINLIKEKYKSNVIVNLNKKNIGYGANIKKCIKYALLNVFFIAMASYITPNFCVFAIYFTYKFFLEFKFTRYFQYILLLNFFLALPGFIYFHGFDYYLFKVSVGDVSTSIRFNIFNKIVIISSLIFFYYIPFVNNKIINKTTYVFKNIKNEYFLILFFLICTFFFNFPSGFFGGGVFYHLSQKILNKINKD